MFDGPKITSGKDPDAKQSIRNNPNRAKCSWKRKDRIFFMFNILMS